MKSPPTPNAILAALTLDLESESFRAELAAHCEAQLARIRGEGPAATTAEREEAKAEFARRFAGATQHTIELATDDARALAIKALANYGFFRAIATAADEAVASN